MSTDLKYKRNWSYEQYASVHFLDGTEQQCYCRTNNKGQVDHIVVDDQVITPERFSGLGIESIHFMTPAKVQVKPCISMLMRAYKKLGKQISESDENLSTMRKISIRDDIAKQLRSKGINLHDYM